MSLSENFKNNEIYNSIESTIKDRFSSSMYGTFVIAWCLWNWQAIYVTFFVDQDIIFQSLELFKIDYIWATYYANWGWHTWWKVLIGPILSVVLALWGLSYLDLQCFKKTCSNKFEQDKVRIERGKELEQGRKEFLEVKAENVIKEKKIEEEMTEEEKWKSEYAELSGDNRFMETLEKLKICIYEFNGQLSYSSDGEEFEMMPGEVAFLEVNNLVSKDRYIIDLTSKGKFFLKEFLKEEDVKWK